MHRPPGCDRRVAVSVHMMDSPGDGSYACGDSEGNMTSFAVTVSRPLQGCAPSPHVVRMYCVHGANNPKSQLLVTTCSWSALVHDQYLSAQLGQHLRRPRYVLRTEPASKRTAGKLGGNARKVSKSPLASVCSRGAKRCGGSTAATHVDAVSASTAHD